jgi:hypothetical protein
MGNRTTPELVGGIISIDPNIDVTPFIETANSLVTEYCTSPSNLPPRVAESRSVSPYMPNYDDSRLELIERYLSAHIYSLRDPLVISEGIGGANSNYGIKTGFNFQATMYGQMAMMLDTAGGLAGLSKRTADGHRKRNIGVLHMGKSSSAGCARQQYPDPDMEWSGGQPGDMLVP